MIELLRRWHIEDTLNNTFSKRRSQVEFYNLSPKDVTKTLRPILVMRMDRTFVFQYWYRNPSNILIFKQICLNLVCLVTTPNLISCVIKPPLPGCSPIASLVASQLLPHHNGSDKKAANNKWSCPVFCNTTEKQIEVKHTLGSETVPVLISDIGKKTVLVLAH